MLSYPDIVEAYLKRQSPKPWKLEWMKKKGISNIIVVPAIAEFENLETLLTSILNNKPDYFPNTLIIFVINNKSTDNKKVKESNRKSLKLLHSIIRQDDIDGDDTMDVVSAGRDANDVVWYENNLPAGWTSHIIGTNLITPENMDVNDINDDPLFTVFYSSEDRGWRSYL